MALLPSEPNAKTTSAKTISSFLHSDEDEDDESFEFKIDEDGEICVFSADKYFNGALEPPPLRREHYPWSFRNRGSPPPPLPSHHHHSPMKKPPGSRPRTPSVRSESSWNSRTHLLPPKTPETRPLPPADSSGKLRRKSFLSAISCNHCFCNGGSSVEIDESKNREANPNPNPKHLQIKNSPVFSSPKSGTRMAADWGDIFEEDGDAEYDEVGSEASSDLFEIESFQGGNPNPFDRPIGVPARTSSHAPSEASVEWSVATASAADFSVASDSEEPKMATSSSSSSPSRGRSRKGKTKNSPKRIVPGILIPTAGCRSEKAVGVAGDAYRRTVTGGRRKNQSSESPFLPPLNRVRGGGGGFGVGSFSAAISTHSQPHMLFI
ncbi:hypothetical protein DM860_005848 [Cuscuta australis]|uniref:Uncharacterized protein n=1 Tax=Cuscuta australis TaxID=267555 RepID=A0A328DS11_9ASTE|nr:hypothetical protein DM860_005848 [Cuscuta australis]